MIRLPERLSQEEKLKRLNEIVDILDIRKCLHTVMGDMFIRGLSGGEKKRASVACELLTDPDIILLDGPTSGLDSSTSLKLVKQLKDFAVTFNKTILVTIHPPSSQIYHLFDKLLLLTRGQVAYFGKAHRVPLDFLGKFGFKCDPLYNPADFLLDASHQHQLVLSRDLNAHVASSEAQETTVQLPSRSLKDRGLKCVPGQSRTHTDNQGIKTVVPGPNTAVPGPHTAATRTIPDVAIIPDRHGSTRQFLTSQNCRVGLPERQVHSRTSHDLNGLTRSYTASTRFTYRIIPDMNRVVPASVLD